MRPCQKCGLEQKVHEFYRAPKSLAGRDKVCRTCRKAAIKVRQQNGPPKARTVAYYDIVAAEGRATPRLFLISSPTMSPDNAA